MADEREDEKQESEGKTEVFFSREDAGATTASGSVAPGDQKTATFTQPAAESSTAPAPPTGSSGTSPAAADRQATDSHDQFDEKPELFVAGAFVGAFVFAKLLKKITGSDD